MKKITYLSLFAATTSMFISNSQAALVIDISGVTGSNVVSYTASGSITVTNATPTFTSSVGAAPISGTWNTAFDNNLGDMFVDGVANDLNRSVNISYMVNSTQFVVIDNIDLRTGTGVGDDFEVDVPASTVYPALMIGDVVSWTGTGTFTLTAETYDTYFNAGMYTKALDGGDYQINIASPVPEPSSTLLLGLGSLALFTRRRK